MHKSFKVFKGDDGAISRCHVEKPIELLTAKEHVQVAADTFDVLFGDTARLLVVEEAVDALYSLPSVALVEVVVCALHEAVEGHQLVALIFDHEPKHVCRGCVVSVQAHSLKHF